MVPEAGLEPARSQWPGDFKSPVSTIPPPGLNMGSILILNINIWRNQPDSNWWIADLQSTALPTWRWLQKKIMEESPGIERRGSQHFIAVALTLGYDSIYLNIKIIFLIYGARGRTWTGTVAMTGGF